MGFRKSGSLGWVKAAGVLLVPGGVGLALWVVAGSGDPISPEERKEIARGHLAEDEGGLAWEVLAALVRPDAEAHWLISRAALQRGDLDAAEVALAEARSLGFADDPMRPEPSAFVGSSSCLECHGAIVRGQQASHHAMAFQGHSDLDLLPIPEGPIADPEAPGVVHHIRRVGEEVRVETEAEGGRFRAVIGHLMGSGHHGVTPVGRDEEGQVVELRLSHYAGGTGWDLTTGHLPDPGTPAGYLGRPLSDQEQQKCMNCHTTRTRWDEPAVGPTVVEGGVRCERCHGPGGNHLAAVALGLAEPAISRPKLATAPQVITLCGDCHRNDEPGPQAESTNPSIVRFQATTLVRSYCYTRSPASAKFDCVSCHDPHRDAETDRRHYEAVCLSCHAGSAGRQEGSAGGDPNSLAAPIACPVDVQQGCIDCHMPRRESAMRNTMFTDHHIRVQDDLGTAGTEQTTAE